MRVGSLDNPGNFGARSVAVYENGAGLYIQPDGVRTKLHGATLWTKLDGTRMRGISVVEQRNESEEEDIQLQQAIAASLAADQGRDQDDTEGQDADSNQESNNNDAASGRDCSICLVNPICMIMKPCNHCCACEQCARRLSRRPCPICRRHVEATERIFF